MTFGIVAIYPIMTNLSMYPQVVKRNGWYGVVSLIRGADSVNCEGGDDMISDESEFWLLTKFCGDPRLFSL